MINARTETVATKPAFRRAFRERRCLILADGFYEWQRQDGRKQPYYIRLREGRPFAFAGLWERWVPPDGQPLDSCTIITTVANDLVVEIHSDPCPQGLRPVALYPGVREVERLQSLLRPYRAEAMVAYPVSTRVNNPANDTPDCLASGKQELAGTSAS